MLQRLQKANDEVDRIDSQIILWQKRRKEAVERRKTIENEEIVRIVRSFRMNSHEMYELLDGLQSGKLGFQEINAMKEDYADHGDVSGQKSEMEGADSHEKEEA